MELASTNPCARGSPLQLAPRVSFRRAGCAVSWSSGLPAGTKDVSPAAVGAVGRASGDLLFRVFCFRRVCALGDKLGGPVGVCGLRYDRKEEREGWARRTHGSTGNGRQPMLALTRRGRAPGPHPWDN